MEQPTIHVAVAEDLAPTMKGIVASLEASDTIAVTIQATDGQDMLDKLRKCEELPDICIIDINMPKMNGYILLSQIKKNWPAMLTLVYTMHYSQAAVEDMIKRGTNGYVLKNSMPEEIVEAVYDIYNNGFHYNRIAHESLFNRIRTRAVKVKSFSEK
jgi:DNA-binding NarL/FixJ family response regulator